MRSDARADLHVELYGCSPDPEGATRKVGAFSVWDLQCSYTGFAGWHLAGGIRNVFNVETDIEPDDFVPDRL